MEALHKIRKGIDTVLSSACVLLFAMMVVVGTYQIVTSIAIHANVYVRSSSDTVLGLLNMNLVTI